MVPPGRLSSLRCYEDSYSEIAVVKATCEVILILN